jgi:hypothetical protein
MFVPGQAQSTVPKMRHEVQRASRSIGQEPNVPVASLLVPNEHEWMVFELSYAQDHQYAEW